ncbi:hypothetical protein GCM10027059_21910 [Myceligenerans halotolerans]
MGAVRVLAASGNTNLAEVELVRSITDTTAVRLYLDETDGLDEDDWTRRSWAKLTEAREAGAALLADGAGPTQEEADAVAEALAEAVDCLRPVPGHGGRPGWPPGGGPDRR